MALTADNAKKSLPTGWHNLVNDIFDLAKEAKVEVMSIVNNQGGIAIRTRVSFPGRFYTRAIRIERESSETCMHCGRFGKRRPAEEVTILCEDCWEAGIWVVRGHTKEPE